MKTSISHAIRLIAIVALLMMQTAQGYSQLSTSPIISSNMVLQREKPVHIWGTATPGERITLQFANQKIKAKTTANGTWQATLQPMPATATPRTMTIKGKTQTLTYDNIVVGEVWIAAGQSNMQYSMVRHKSFVAPAKGPDLSIQELQKPQNPNIHVFVSQRQHQSPWAEASAQSLPQVSTVGYYFIKNLQDSLHIPVGIITVALGGTRIEGWTPREAYAQSPLFQAEIKNTGKISGWGTGMQYHQLMEPVIPYTIRGFLWYQGENNCGINDTRYADKFEVMTTWLRTKFMDSTLPFYYVVLAPHIYSDRLHRGGTALTAEALPRFREQQIKARQMVSNTEYITIFDLVDNLRDIHPSYKWFVGQRLARIALHRNYGYTNILYRGPELQKAIKAGNKLQLHFANCGKGLKTFTGADRRLEWIEIAGSDGIFHPALADIVDTTQVSVSSPYVSAPEYVRMGWHETAVPNLVNSEGLTATPFGSTKAE